MSLLVKLISEKVRNFYFKFWLIEITWTIAIWYNLDYKTYVEPQFL